MTNKMNTIRSPWMAEVKITQEQLFVRIQQRGLMQKLLTGKWRISSARIPAKERHSRAGGERE